MFDIINHKLFKMKKIIITLFSVCFLLVGMSGFTDIMKEAALYQEKISQ